MCLCNYLYGCINVFMYFIRLITYILIFVEVCMRLLWAAFASCKYITA